MATEPVVTAQQRYAALEQKRGPFLTRARDCAALTVPFVMPPAGSSNQTEYITPYQSLGAQGVRTLASKLLMALYPHTPFFRYALDDIALGQVKAKSTPDKQRGDFEDALGSRERAVMTEVSKCLFRPAAFVAFQHLLITGNILLYVPPKEGRTRSYRLDQYVVKRAPDGSLLEIVIKEQVDPGQLTSQVRTAVGLDPVKTAAGGEPVPSDQELLYLYTHIILDEDKQKWFIHQEINDIIVPDSDGNYDFDLLPFMPLRLSVQPNEDYGRSYVEEYLGDLDSLEGLSQALVEGAAAAARVVFLVNPNGTTRLQVVAKAKNLDVVSGKAEDVGTLQLNKSADLQVTKAQAEAIASRLAAAFLMNAAVQRNGDRVTAEEIKYLASELDAAIGGLYTLLAADMQLPSVRLFEKRMETGRNVPPLPSDLVQPVIVTGLEALGRGADQANLKAFLTDVIQVLTPELALKYLNPTEFLKRSAAAYGIDTQGLLNDPATIAQMDQQSQLQQLVSQLGPNAVNQAGGALQKMMQNQHDASQAGLDRAAAQQGQPPQ